VMRFDDLKPLVHQRGGIDGDLRPHAPGRVREGVGGAYTPQICRTPTPERSAGCRQHDGPHSINRHIGQQLKQRGVLGVDGISIAPVRARTAATRSPPATRVSLLARATGMPRSRAARVGCSPAAPTSPLSTRSGSAASINAPRSALAGMLPRRRRRPCTQSRDVRPGRSSLPGECRTQARTRPDPDRPRSPRVPERQSSQLSQGRGCAARAISLAGVSSQPRRERFVAASARRDAYSTSSWAVSQNAATRATAASRSSGCRVSTD